MERHPETLEALKLLTHARALAGRIEERSRAVLGEKGHAREKAWLADAHAVLTERLLRVEPALEGARRLPELERERSVFARVPQNAWVDALERLWSGIQFHLGRRAPLVEALFPHTRFPLLRKPRPDTVRTWAADFRTRLDKGYVQRILANDEAAFALPLLEEIARHLADWEALLTGQPLTGILANKARKLFITRALELEPAYRQARFLYEAALVGLPGVGPLPASDEELVEEEADELDHGLPLPAPVAARPLVPRESVERASRPEAETPPVDADEPPPADAPFAAPAESEPRLKRPDTEPELEARIEQVATQVAEEPAVVDAPTKGSTKGKGKRGRKGR